MLNGPQTEQKMFAYKESHYIPGIRYEGTHTPENEDDEMAKSVVLKQL